MELKREQWVTIMETWGDTEIDGFETEDEARDRLEQMRNLVNQGVGLGAVLLKVEVLDGIGVISGLIGKEE